MSKLQKIMLSAVMLCAAAVMILCFTGYQSARREYVSLKSELEASTASWKQINEDKLSVQRELKAAREALREAELTISESEERAETLREEIGTLEREIEALRSDSPSNND